MSNPISTVGTVATEPRLVRTQSGISLCTFRLASGERRYDREQNKWIDGETNWYTVSSFRGLADHAHASLHKGDRVFVSGRLRIRNWEQAEKSGTSVEIDADSLGHDLRWGVSQFTKQSKEEAEPSATTASAPPHTGDGTTEGSSSGQTRWADAPEPEAATPAAAEGTSDGFLPAAA